MYRKQKPVDIEDSAILKNLRAEFDRIKDSPYLHNNLPFAEKLLAEEIKKLKMDMSDRKKKEDGGDNSDTKKETIEESKIKVNEKDYGPELEKPAHTPPDWIIGAFESWFDSQ